MAISSQFYKDVSKIEKKLLKMSKRQLKAFLIFFFIEIPILAVETILLPDWAFLLVTIPTALLLGLYPVLQLMNKWRIFKRKIELFFLHEDRFYDSGQIRRYESHEFSQKETVKETDKIE